MDSRQIVKQEMIRVAQVLHTKNMLAAADGNISYRLDNGEILITPSGKSKAIIQPYEIALMSSKGDALNGLPSSEKMMHVTIYNHCPKARCVIHAHPATAIAWTIAQPWLTELPGECMSELIVAAGKIPIAPYALPGSKEMGEALTSLLPDSRIIILSRHGALTWGEDLQEALNGMERLEHTADILMKATLLGGLTKLPKKEVEALRKLRETMGERII
jgi:L-fuculose-phosphate aldolase